MSKVCIRRIACDGSPLPLGAFGVDPNASDGRTGACKACLAARKAELRAARRAERLASDHAPLRAEDFDVGVGNVGPADGAAAAEKRQEYNRYMGELHSVLRTGEPIPPHLVKYVADLAEQERRFQNRRVARSVSLVAANEALHVANLRLMAEQYLADKIVPAGYATKKTRKATRRAVVLHLSDLHLGADLSPIDNPVPFGANEEARRLEHVVVQAADYKRQYRDHTELVLILNGDLIEGMLDHDRRDGAPLAEQTVIFWRLMGDAIAFLASQFPSVRVVARPGNHGRNKQRHHGRATSSKWDGHEWTVAYGLMMMGRACGNVTWDVQRQPIAKVDLFGQVLGVAHGDTEVKLGAPDTAASKNALILDKINATRVYGCEFAGWVFGHFHKGVLVPGRPAQVWNAALIPPNGHARTEGWFGQACGQWLFEAVPGHVVGDARFVEVGVEQDRNESLGSIVRPFRLGDVP